jgi:hypothetical protein
VLFEIHGGAVPASAFSNKKSFKLVGGKGAGNVFRTESILPITMKRKVPLMVDVGDKNCLAQLTVALKLNHGVRQWLYIIAGVLFFRSFFCTSKRKNIKTYSLFRFIYFLP